MCFDVPLFKFFFSLSLLPFGSRFLPLPYPKWGQIIPEVASEFHKKCFHFFVQIFPIYRVIHKFSDTWNELFVVNWFISKNFWEKTKWKKVSSPHYLKILIKLSKHGISYSLKCDPRSISKITFYANLRVSPIDTELW